MTKENAWDVVKVGIYIVTKNWPLGRCFKEEEVCHRLVGFEPLIRCQLRNGQIIRVRAK